VNPHGVPASAGKTSPSTDDSTICESARFISRLRIRGKKEASLETSIESRNALTPALTPEERLEHQPTAVASGSRWIQELRRSFPDPVPVCGRHSCCARRNEVLPSAVLAAEMEPLALHPARVHGDQQRLRVASAAPCLVALALLLTLLTGCQTTDSDSVNISGGAYYESGIYDPWYYGGDWDGDVIVTPPDRPEQPPRPAHPIALPPVSTPRPTPLPSIPRTPMPRARGR